MDATTLSIFHYHLQPGGVTTIVSLSVRAIAQHVTGIDRIRLVTGRRDGTDAFMEKLADADTGRLDIELSVHESIDYATKDNLEQAESIARELYDEFSGSVWWIHNYQLGKNPAFTEALLRIVAEHPEQPVIFHIHDFPECARYQNLEFLRAHTSRPIYPVADNVRYAVINGRDRDLLIEAGIPEPSVFLLTNPVVAQPLDRSKAAETRKRAAEAFGGDFPKFDPDTPTALFPVRTIRRKNVLESAMLVEAGDSPTNLIVTLPGVSEREKPYSDVVESAFEHGLVRGMWGIGERLDAAGIGFLDLVASADIVTSASVQEGFGIFYVEALLWGFPLAARHIDILGGIEDFLDRDSVHLYDTFRIPLDVEDRNALLERYERRIARLSEFIEPDIAHRLRDEAAALTGEESVDASYLDVALQMRTLERISESHDYRTEIRDANSGLYRSFYRLIDESGTVEPAEQDPRFTFAGFAETTARMLGSFSESPGAGRDREPARDVQEHLIESFAQLGYFRLLYE